MTTGTKTAWVLTLLVALMALVNLLFYLFEGNPLSLLSSVVTAALALVSALFSLDTTRRERQ